MGIHILLVIVYYWCSLIQSRSFSLYYNTEHCMVTPPLIIIYYTYKNLPKLTFNIHNTKKVLNYWVGGYIH